MAKERAIYGMAMPLPQLNVNTEKENGIQQYHTLSMEAEAVKIWNEIPLTLQHDHSRIMGNLYSGVSIKVYPHGVFFKYVPDSKRGNRAWRDVQTKRLRHCSVSYRYQTTDDREGNKRLEAIKKVQAPGQEIKASVIWDLLVEEVCLTNSPGQRATFATVDLNDPRLKGISFSTEAESINKPDKSPSASFLTSSSIKTRKYLEGR